MRRAIMATMFCTICVVSIGLPQTAFAIPSESVEYQSAQAHEDLTNEPATSKQANERHNEETDTESKENSV